MEDIDDVTNLANLSDLLNQDAINQNLDIEKIEREMIGSTGVRRAAESDPAREYDEAMRELANDTGIVLGDIIDDSEDDDKFANQTTARNDTLGDDMLNEEDHSSEDFIETLHRGNKGRDSDINVLRAPAPGRNMPNRISPNDKKNWGVEPPPLQEPVQHKPSRPHSGIQSGMPQQPRMHSGMQSGMQSGMPQQPRMHSGMSNRPQQGMQQQNKYYNPNRHNPNQFYKEDEMGVKYNHLDQVMQDYAGDNMDQFNIEQEQREDTKTILLEDIDELRFELESDGVELDRIPNVNSDSTLEDVQLVHKMLRMKYDRRRYNGFGNELVLAGVHGLEHVFNGQRKWGPYTPDLSGWHNTVRAKLRRMRYETATVVSDVMNDYNIGPITRIMLELIPSAIIYSKDRREQRGQDNYTFDQMSDAYNELAEFE